MKYALLVCIFLFMVIDVFADQVKPLFIIQRTKNANEVHYDVNIGADGKLNPKQPVIAYWIMAAKDGHREKLGFFEKKAYGFKCRYDKTKGMCRLVIKSFKKREIEVFGSKEGATAEMVIDGKPSYLDKMFITESEGKPFPKVRFIELFGIDKKSGEKVYEKISV
jgi:Domain of unknown function (DUF4833)